MFVDVYTLDGKKVGTFSDDDHILVVGFGPGDDAQVSLAMCPTGEAMATYPDSITAEEVNKIILSPEGAKTVNNGEWKSSAEKEIS